MNKVKEYCLTHDSIAYYSGWGGIEIKKIEYGIEDKVVYVSNAWHGEKKFGIAKIHHGNDPYFIVKGHRIPLNECIRMGI